MNIMLDFLLQKNRDRIRYGPLMVLWPRPVLTNDTAQLQHSLTPKKKRINSKRIQHSRQHMHME